VNKIIRVAIREFIATAMTKAFIIGAFVVPVLMVAVMAILFPLLLNESAPAVEGSLALIDRSQSVGEDVRQRLRPEAIAQRRSSEAREIAAEVEARVGDVVPDGAVAQALEGELEKVPKIRVEMLPLDADVEAEKQPLRDKTEGGRLGLAVIDAHAITRADGADGADGYGGFELFVQGELDDRVIQEMRAALHGAVKHQRIVAADLDPAAIDALTTVDAPRTREVTEEGERASMSELRPLISFGFLAVLMISVMIGGQYLLTTTVEEKSSRVVEVLLSAMSPMQLMTGKILGQLGVGLTILAIYSSLGGGALFMFGLADLLGVVNAVLLVVYFLIAYVTVAAMMAAVGSAVNDIREAQSLQGPVMVTLIIPYMLWFPISRDPNSVFATTISFIPPVSPFVMMLRITSTEPPPAWQIGLSILIGLAGVYIAVWAASKIFRIGLLMFGKPPNFITLLKWVRQA
jgi:ABC-2 type transport system permease protein